MPFAGVTDAMERHPNLSKYSPKARKAWFKVWNECEIRELKKEGNSDKNRKNWEGKCFATAYKVANRVDGKKSIDEGTIFKGTIQEAIMANVISKSVLDEAMGNVTSDDSSLAVHRLKNFHEDLAFLKDELERGRSIYVARDGVDQGKFKIGDLVGVPFWHRALEVTSVEEHASEEELLPDAGEGPEGHTSDEKGNTVDMFDVLELSDMHQVRENRSLMFLKEVDVEGALKGIAKKVGFGVEEHKEGQNPEKFIAEQSAFLKEIKHLLSLGEKAKDMSDPEDEVVLKWQGLIYDVVKTQDSDREEDKEIAGKRLNFMKSKDAKYVGRGIGRFDGWLIFVSSNGRVFSPDRKGIRVLWDLKKAKNTIFWVEKNIQEARDALKKGKKEEGSKE